MEKVKQLPSLALPSRSAGEGRETEAPGKFMGQGKFTPLDRES